MGSRMSSEEASASLKPAVRAAVYARYSSEMQSPTSANDQIDRINHLAQKDQIATRLYAGSPIQILPEWVQKDEAITGKIAGRRGYQAILNGIRRQAFDLLIVDDLSRLTRSLGNLLELYQLLRHYDVELVSISDRLSSADPNSKTFFTVKGMVADFGNEAHAERTRRGLEARARSEFSTGQRPYGYTSVATQKEKRKGKEVSSHFKIIIDPAQAAIVREIYELYASGHGRVYVAKYLNEKGVPPPKSYSRGWKVGPLERILRYENYIGKWTYNKRVYSIDPDTGRKIPKARPRSDWIVTQRDDLRIISQDLWDQVQKRIQENEECRRKVAKTRKQRVFGKQFRIDNVGLLSGILSCAVCGSACSLVTGRHGGYYGCIEAHRHATCNQKFLIRKDVVEKEIIDYINEHIISNPQAIQYAADQYNQSIKDYLRNAPNRKKDVETELNRISREISNLIRFITDGTSGDIESISQALRERESRKMKLEQELLTIGNTDDQKLLVTPYLIKDRLTEILKEISETRDNTTLKHILTEPIIVSKLQGSLELRGRMNMGSALGSRQCAIGWAKGFEPSASRATTWRSNQLS